MDLRDRIMEYLLSIKDGVLNIVTLGLWERIRGTRRFHIYK